MVAVIICFFFFCPVGGFPLGIGLAAAGASWTSCPPSPPPPSLLAESPANTTLLLRPLLPQICLWFVRSTADLPELTTAVCVGISGHMGARLIGKLEQILSRKFALAQDETVVVIQKKDGTPGVF